MYGLVGSMERSYFEEMYRTDIDPWQFESSWYEQRKYDLTMAALPERRYRSAFEPGCSVGVLSRLLAQRCDHLLATDIVPAVLDRARERCRPVPTAHFELRPIPEAWPTGPFDLVVLSEIAYYFDRPTVSEIITHLWATTTASSTIVGVHWRGETNYPLTGDEAHELIDRQPGLRRDVHHVEADFLLDVWSRQ
jgi:SAM-dependent methyltransferase